MLPDQDELAKLEKLIEKRRLKDRLVSLLSRAKETQSQKLSSKSGAPKRVDKSNLLAAKKGMSYSNIMKELQKALDEKLITEADIASVLDESEIAGNQHTLLFDLPGSNDQKRKECFEAICSPSSQLSPKLTIKHFLNAPNRRFCQLVSKTSDEVVLKFVATRTYWVTNMLSDQSTLTRQVFERLREQERSPVILKASISKKLVQIRVCPTEKGSAGSVSSHFQFAKEVLGYHYNLEEGWFPELRSLTICDAFPGLVKDDATLVSLWADTPENNDITSTIKNNGRPNTTKDLRKNNKEWRYADGYARTSISGFFKSGEKQTLFARLHDDKAPKNSGLTRLARLFVSRYCEDKELENAIEGIRRHL